MAESNMKPTVMLVCVGLLLGPALVACEEQGPAEKLGERIDETVEKAGDKVEEAADKIEKKTD